MKSQLRGNSLGVAHVVFFVIATAAPLAALVGVSPAAIAFGNGIGVPGSFVVTGLLYVLFSVGYTAMSRHVRNAGAFYALISQGLGGVWGVAAAFVAVLAYGGVQLAVYTLLGLFLSAAVEQHTGSNISWWVFTLGAVAVVHILAQRSVIFSGRVLSALLMAEILIITVLDIVIVAHGLRHGHLSFAGFHPQIVFSAGFGASLAFVVPSYLGFEASTIFAEEARDPAKTIPRATYIAVVFITALYALSEWAVIQAHDPGTVVEAARRDPATFYFAVSSQYLGAAATNMMNLLLWTSLIAAALSLQTTLSRYLFALGRERVIWTRLATTHPRHQSPYIAGRAVTFAVTAIVASVPLLELIRMRLFLRARRPLLPSPFYWCKCSSAPRLWRSFLQSMALRTSGFDLLLHWLVRWVSAVASSPSCST
jgi:amino acid transporter